MGGCRLRRTTRQAIPGIIRMHGHCSVAPQGLHARSGHQQLLGGIARGWASKEMKKGGGEAQAPWGVISEAAKTRGLLTSRLYRVGNSMDNTKLDP